MLAVAVLLLVLHVLPAVARGGQDDEGASNHVLQELQGMGVVEWAKVVVAAGAVVGLRKQLPFLSGNQ